MANKLDELVKRKLETALKQLATPAFLLEVGEQVKKDIIKRTKLGYGVSEPEGGQSKLKPLSGNYTVQRKKLPLDSTTSPKKSNLTQTGKMLNDIKVKGHETTITLTLGSELSNNKAKWNADMGRVFFNVSKVQVTKLTSLIKLKLKELLK